MEDRTISSGKQPQTRDEAGQTVSAPSISLPKGGGAIRGIGEKFAANPVTGTGSLTVPIATSPGRSGFGPRLSLSYDSGGGNGTFGFGWNLSLPSITRKTDKGLPHYRDTDESDVFILSGAEDLVPVLADDGARWSGTRNIEGIEYRIHRYRPRIEGLFARIERWTNIADPGDVHWRSITKDNTLTVYGKEPNSRIADPEDPSRIFSWLICETRDDKGNAVIYQYKEDDGAGVDLTRIHERNRGDRHDQRRKTNRYIKCIRYGNRETLLDARGRRPRFLTDAQIQNAGWMFEVVFDYGEHDPEVPTPEDSGEWDFREDPFSSYRSGFEVRTTRLCQRVLMFHHFPGEEGVGENCLVRSMDFTYSHEEDPDSARNPVYTFLRAVSQFGYKRRGSGYLKRSLPPVEFEYSQPIVQDTVEEVDETSLENLPIGVDGAAYQWTDLHGEGIPGILTEQAGAWFYKRNLSPINGGEAEFAPSERVALNPNLGLADGARFMDLAGDGQPDLVMLEGPTPGLYEHDGGEGWQPFRAFTARLTRDMRDPNLRFVDLDGDGHADVLITEDDAFVWHASLAEEGFGPARRVQQALDEEKGPRLVFADGTQSVYLSDLSGDGLTDLVRIRNGEVCYWPNRGYGRFGAKITMDQAPWFDSPDQFDHKRIRLADIDGTGTTDIVYLHRDGVRIYFNQSGNSWSEPQALSVFPRVDELVSIAATDLLGNGTACLVWCSPLPGDAGRPMRYVNLMGGKKPHLLIKTRNNLGAETEVQYAPSTKFYLADKLAGKPWITRLPFPVHVVEKVIVKDKWRGTRFATTYSYHHGYFDGIEREFRGFGRVDQIDAESFGEFAEGNAGSPYITDDKTLYQPPVKTITWFHTGAFLDREHILSQYHAEYFPTWFEALNPAETNVLGAFREDSLPEPDLHPGDLSGEELRQALRACKGMMLRQEVYELDVDALERGEERPVKLFTTAYHNCHIRMLQPRAMNPHAVFLVTESEAITYHYELDLRPGTLTPDPRIAHTLNLNVDEYGNVLQAVAVSYPRQRDHEDSTLPSDALTRIRAVQSERHLAYTETRYTKDIDTPDDYRLRVPCEVKTYELTGIAPGSGAPVGYFTLEDLRGYRLSNRYQPSGIAVTDIGYHEIAAGRTAKRCIEHVRMLFFRDDLGGPLDFGHLGRLGLPYETYKLALTDTLLDAVFTDTTGRNKLEDIVDGATTVRDKLRDASVSGYLAGAALAASFPEEDTTGQYWIRSGIAGFEPDAAEHFFLPERYTDPFGHTTILDYDDHDLFIRSSTDPVGNSVAVEAFDYRILAPRAMRDINNNLSEVAFDILGLPAAMAIEGKGAEGDHLEDLAPEMLDPAPTDRFRFFTDTYDEDEARRWLGSATARHVYYFGEEVDDTGNVVAWGAHPACAAAILRERHVADLPSGERSDIQAAFEYSDGGGNVLVKKVQAEPETAGGPLRWIANGKTVLNNKGKPVKQYEPYFSVDEFGQPNHRFEDPHEQGVTPIMYYDAPGRLVRTELPDGSFSRVEFSPWHVTSYDPNDTVLEAGNDWYLRRTDPAHRDFADYGTAENQRAARLAAEHADTPASVYLDSLGREVVSVAHNRVKDGSGALRDEKYVTFTKLDAEGKPLWIRDARGNLVMQYITPQKPTMWSAESNEDIPSGSVPCYDIAGNLLFQHSMDGGDRWMLNDAAGNPFYAWDLNDRITRDGERLLENRIFHTTYDALRRPREHRLRINDGTWQVVERFVYGDKAGLFPVRPAHETPEAQERNLRGQVYHHYDPSGRITNERFDFKGNLLEVKRRLATAYNAPVIDWPEDFSDAGLEGEMFTQRTEYDALNRMTRQENWHLEERTPAVYRPRYNQRGLLAGETLSVRGVPTNAIVSIAYNAKCQREFIEFGNGTTTTYDYDRETFRLIGLRTIPRTDLALLQDLHYTYDPVGNITGIRDDAQQTVYFANAAVEPHCRYEYDALYRLIRADGREHAAQNNIQRDGRDFEPVIGIPFPNSPEALQPYTERYEYDPVGNILSLSHSGGHVLRWKRCYQYALDSNRVLATGRPSDLPSPEDDCPPNYVAAPSLSVRYDYDIHGSMLNLNRTPDEYRLRWDYRDMIHHVNMGGGGQAWYNYDAGKQRTRKRKRNGSTVEERLYLGGIELYRRWVGGSLVEEIETHHLFVDDQRLLLVDDVLTTDNTSLGTGTLFRYQYGNHLGSVVLELDADAAIISYEEYHPYGTTAYQARGRGVRATAKRYRYTGMERDEETGLSYHTARYYAPAIGAWCNADPKGIKAGINYYVVFVGNPINWVDLDGAQPRRLPLPGGVENSYEIPMPLAPQIPAPNEGLADSNGLSEALVSRIQWIGEVSPPRTLQRISNVEDRETLHLRLYLRRPIESGRVGEPTTGQGDINISTVAARFSANTYRGQRNSDPHQGLLTQIDTRDRSGDASQVNAFRHALWQALITKEFGAEFAREVGNAHEGGAALSQESRFERLYEADTQADLRNNFYGRLIGRSLEDMPARDVALAVLYFFKEFGLFVARREGDSYVLVRQQISDEQFEVAVRAINESNNYGFTEEQWQNWLRSNRGQTTVLSD
ncbi:SpvB/TcaC N-terminal domain-containing protein [Methylohalobius crimeensis]|uniref:SpvB/TcaC N-terminal domain-containing protein n=1 Tax=Methylohalobius crimeensis TaxID=244365 RepID=UPI0003B4B20C|nr:SpvB/TcaC N-terminal domain-containing protein [Methylohalobius crimeensis]